MQSAARGPVVGNEAGPPPNPQFRLDDSRASGNFQSPIVPIGGGFASGVGGYIDGWNIATQAPYSLDVANWVVDRFYDWQALSCSGNLGTPDARQVNYRYAWSAELIWDYRRTGDLQGAMRGTKGNQLVFWFGEILSNIITGQSGGNVFPFMWCPDGVIVNSRRTLDAVRKRMTRVPIAGVCRTHMFECPKEGMPNDPSTIAGAYNQWYQQNGPQLRNKYA